LRSTPEQNAAVLLTLLVFFLAFMPIFWYAAPLIVWQKMPVFQSMFYSFFSVLHAYRAFLVYFLCWIVIGVLCPAILAGMLTLLIGKGLAMLLLFLLTIVLTVVLYCSFYPTYVDMFGIPDLPSGHEPDLS
ncbi:MAG: BPSS1780 family membrane protein, partial [Burkholderiaceae bacterium]|nr:BPSS1780 family membrane protein [Burkholderiaceae bacterium]